MATMLTITIDSKVAGVNAVSQRVERTELAWMLSDIARQLVSTNALSNPSLRHRDGSTAAGSWTYTAIALQ